MTDWFLRPINPDPAEAWCFQVVPTGAINVYYNYRPYFERLAELISQTDGNGDEVFLVGWRFDMQEPLKDKKSLLTWLQAARGRNNTRVRMLMSGNNGNDPEKIIAAKGNAKGDGKIDALIDNQLDPGRPHHQKAAFIKTRANTHLFLGGMDVTNTRVGHFFDVQAEVMGVAADLGRITLEERWESVTGRTPGSRSTVIPRGEKVEHHAQFIRTYCPIGKSPPASTRNFAPNGEHTHYELLKKAITNAKTSIYLEEQYFWSMEQVPPKTVKTATDPAHRSDISDFPALLEDVLAQAINRGVQVVVIGPNFDDAGSKDFKDWRAAIVDKIRKATSGAPHPPVFLKVNPDMMFVHSKAWIFDDEFVVIGSANFWKKSLNSVGDAAESEFGVAFTSEVKGKALGFEKAEFARALRLRLWERLRQGLDPNYRFPFIDTTSYLQREIIELKSDTAGGEQPFSDMP